MAVESTEPEIVCTAAEADWGDDKPNLLMYPPCQCPRCAPEPSDEPDEGSWLRLPGKNQRFRVEPASLGDLGRATLG